MASIEDLWHDKNGQPNSRYGRGKRWRVVWREPGGKKRSETVIKLDDARRRAREVELDRDRGGLALSRKEMEAVTFTTLLDAYRRDPVIVADPTKKPRESYLRSLLPMMEYVAAHHANKPVTSVCNNQLEWTSLVVALQSRGTRFSNERGKAISSATINRYMNAQRTLVQFGKLVGILPPGTPIPIWRSTERAERRKRQGKRQALTPGQLQRILECAPDPRANFPKMFHRDYWRLFIEVGIVTGARIGELLALTVDDLDPRANTISFNKQASLDSRSFADQKTDQSFRTVPINRDLVSRLREHIELTTVYRAGGRPKRVKRPDGTYAKVNRDRSMLNLLFPNRDGKMHSRSNVRERIWLPTLERAELPPMRFHDLRGSIISNMMAKGVPGVVVQQYIGHADIQTTLTHYTIAPGEDMTDLITRAAEIAPQEHDENPA